jgi:hypothetical protein
MAGGLLLGDGGVMWTSQTNEAASLSPGGFAELAASETGEDQNGRNGFVHLLLIGGANYSFQPLVVKKYNALSPVQPRGVFFDHREAMVGYRNH